MQPQIPIDQEKIEAFCKKWKITEFSLFGSVLREDFRPDSDVDVLLSFDKTGRWTLFDMVDLQNELEKLFKRNVDVMTRRSIEASKNPFRKKAILSTTQTIYHVS